MAEVYILYSPSIDSYYIGSCEDFEKRLSQHLNGVYKIAFTKKAHDRQKYLLIQDLSYSQARQIEIHIKKMKSVKYISNIKK
ncbi:GIY-YIG nuclease family protein [Christiangramia crocea]|uniref:GIY-YIG nuclease family protein n=1 Tax=Christiangramia crocea TaxID=2904124 RepID=UPI003C2C8C50